jgi:hypothetical protein
MRTPLKIVPSYVVNSYLRVAYFRICRARNRLVVSVHLSWIIFSNVLSTASSWVSANSLKSIEHASRHNIVKLVLRQGRNISGLALTSRFFDLREGMLLNF